jgi:phosphoribosylcarboxyaminoimidazole (NCAIR) mutase
MRRRDFIAGVGGSAAALPVAARAQQPATPVIGFLGRATADEFAYLVAAFREGLAETGYFEGQNVTIEYRWADQRTDRLPALATELVNRQVAVIFTSGGAAPTLAAKAATSTIPIVFAMGGDPVKTGLVASIGRPDGNVTGVSFLATGITSKQLTILRDLVPNAATIAVLVNPNNLEAQAISHDAQEASRGRGHAFFIEPASIDCIGGAPSDSRSVRAARIRFGGRPNELWAQRKKRLSVRRHLCEPTSQGRQTFRTTHPVADEIRPRHQPQDSEGARFECSQFHTIARRRGDRITRRLLHLLTAGFGTKRTLPPCRTMSAFGGKADVNERQSHVRC